MIKLLVFLSLKSDKCNFPAISKTNFKVYDHQMSVLI